MSVKDDFVHVREAAELLGVCGNTVRTWGAAGKIPEHRHPVNNYRLHQRKDLESVLNEMRKPKRGANESGYVSLLRSRQMPSTFKSPNFDFLAKHDEVLAKHPALAERYVFDNANSALVKLRQFAELLAEHCAACAGIAVDERDSFLNVLDNLWNAGITGTQSSQLLHRLRKAGTPPSHALASGFGTPTTSHPKPSTAPPAENLMCSATMRCKWRYLQRWARSMWKLVSVTSGRSVPGLHQRQNAS